MLKRTALCCLLALNSTALLANENAHSTPTHSPGVFIGSTTTDGHTEFTYGLEYEYRFSEHWGVGAIWEKTNEAHEGEGAEVYLGALYYHPMKEMHFGIGYGKENSDGPHGSVEDLYRVSAAYDFHVGDFEISPMIAKDFVSGEENSVVFGISLLRPF